MSNQGLPPGPLSPYERQQMELAAAYEAKQEQIAERADHLLSEYGPEFEKMAEIQLVDDEQVKKLAAENMAYALAEQNIARPDLMDRQDYQRVADQAIGEAYKTDELARQEPPETEKPAMELPGEGPEKSSGVLFEPETPARQTEQDPPQQQVQDPEQQQAQDPGRQAEATPEREPETDPERQAVRTYADMTREHAEIVAENSPQEQAEPEERRPRFYEDLKQEHANALGKDNDPSEEKDKEQGDAEQKKLNFFEDRNPMQDHGMEH